MSIEAMRHRKGTANALARENHDRQTARIVRAMAYDRETFKNRVEEHLGGALLEFYKAQLAEKNGHTDWVQHWRSEVGTLLGRTLMNALAHPTKGRWNRRKAFDEAVREMTAADASYRRIATNQIIRDFKLRRVKIPLDHADTQAFWERVASEVSTALPP